MLFTATTSRASRDRAAFVLAVANHQKALSCERNVSREVIRGKECDTIVTEPKKTVTLDAVLIKILHAGSYGCGRNIPNTVEAVVAAAEGSLFFDLPCARCGGGIVYDNILLAYGGNIDIAEASATLAYDDMFSCFQIVFIGNHLVPIASERLTALGKLFFLFIVNADMCRGFADELYFKTADDLSVKVKKNA
jgi:uncharacterized protein (DUF983 family)